MIKLFGLVAFAACAFQICQTKRHLKSGKVSFRAITVYRYSSPISFRFNIVMDVFLAGVLFAVGVIGITH